jgi:hypothetical protein
MIQHPRRDVTQRTARAVRSMSHGSLGGNVASARPYTQKRRGVYEPASLPLLFEVHADGFTLGNGDDVTSWVDTVNGWVLQGYTDPGIELKYSPTRMNGHPAVYAEPGVKSRGMFYEYVSPAKQTGDATLVMVCDQPASGASTRSLLAFYDASGNDILGELWVEHATTEANSRADSVQSFATGAGVSGVHVVSMTRGAAGVALHVDGVEVASSPTAQGPTVWDYPHVLVGRGAAVSVARLYQGAASPSQLAAIVGPLMAKYL